MLILIKLLPFLLIKRKENTGLEENIFNLKVSISKKPYKFFINTMYNIYKSKLYTIQAQALFLYKTLDI